MNKIPLIMLCGCMLFAACNNNSDSAGRTDVSIGTNYKTTDEMSWNIPWYKRLEGNVGGEAVVANLLRFPNSTYGVYSINKTGESIYLFDASSMGSPIDSLVLDETVMDELDPYSNAGGFWRAKIEGLKIVGKYMSKDSSTFKGITLQEAYPAGSYPFKIHYKMDSVQLFKSKPESPVATSLYAIAMPAKEDRRLDFIAQHAKQMVDSAATLSDEISTLVDKQNKVFFNAYLAEYGKEAIDTSQPMFSFFNEVSLTSAPIFNSKDYVAMHYMTYMYMGGAHGVANSIMHCYDVANAKKMQWSDLFKVNEKTLQPYLEANFRKQYGIATGKPLTAMLFEDKLAPNHNFHFNDKYIIFTYNPYEVGPYVMGNFDVKIPISEIKQYVQPAVLARLGL